LCPRSRAATGCDGENAPTRAHNPGHRDAHRSNWRVYPTRRGYHPTRAALRASPPLRPRGGEFAQVAGRALTPDHQRVWVEMMSEYLRAGRLEARAGSIPVAQLARCLGCELRRDGHVPAKVEPESVAGPRSDESSIPGSLRVLQRGAGMREFTLENTLQLVDSPTWRPGQTVLLTCTSAFRRSRRDDSQRQRIDLPECSTWTQSAKRMS